MVRKNNVEHEQVSRVVGCKVPHKLVRLHDKYEIPMKIPIIILYILILILYVLILTHNSYVPNEDLSLPPFTQYKILALMTQY